MKLIPQPQSMTMQEGFYPLTYTDRITLRPCCPPNAYDYAKLLAQELEAVSGMSLMIDRRMVEPHKGIVLTMDASLGEEHYTLTVTAQGITITGGDEAGLLYGVQTLRQILRQEGPVVPCLTISDSPALKARGLFYDATRCRIPTMDFMKELADRCAFYKMNQLHLYIEHTFLYDGFSEVWRDDTPFTAQDILELDQYCQKLHVELVPAVVTLGHLYKVLRTKTYHHLSEVEEAKDAKFSFFGRMHHHTLDTTNDASLPLVYRMIDEFVSLFSSNRFNINGDEPFDLGRGRGSKLAGEVGAHKMYVDWIAKICQHVVELGKQPMFWGDIILAEPENMKFLPENVICMNWDYDPADREDHAKKLHDVGARQYLCPGIHGWKQTINLFDSAYRNVRKMAVLAHKYNGEGLLVTEWGDFGHLQDPESSMPGIIYAAAMSWNQNIPSIEELNEAISVVEYGDPSGKIMSVLLEMSKQVVANWGYTVEFAEITQGRIPDKTITRFWEDYRPFMEPVLPRAKEINETIDRCQEEVCRLMPYMTGRQRMLPYLIMSNCQKLLNQFFVYVTGTKGMEVDPLALAAELETWYRDYATLWRRSSREGELFRNSEVIFWMADYLRSSL